MKFRWQNNSLPIKLSNLILSLLLVCGGMPLAAGAALRNEIATGTVDAQVNFSAAGIDQILTDLANTILADPATWDPPQAALDSSPLEQLKTIIQQGLDKLKITYQSNNFTINQLHLAELKLGKLKINYQAADKSFKFCLPIDNMRFETSLAAGNLEVNNVALNFSTQPTFCLNARITFNAAQRPIFQIDKTEVGRHDLDINLTAQFFKDGEDLYVQTRRCLAKLKEDTLADAAAPSFPEKSAEIFALYCTKDQSPTPDEAAAAEVTPDPADPHAALWAWIEAHEPAVRQCLDILGQSFKQDSNQRFTYQIFGLSIVSQVTIHQAHPACSLTMAQDLLHMAVQETKRDDPASGDSLQNIINGKLLNALNSLLAENATFTSLIEQVAQPKMAVGLGQLNLTDILQNQKIQHYQDYLTEEFAALDPARLAQECAIATPKADAPDQTIQHTPDANLVPHLDYHYDDQLPSSVRAPYTTFGPATAEDTADIKKMPQAIRRYLAALATLLNGIDPRQDNDDIFEILGTHQEKLKYLIGHQTDLEKCWAEQKISVKAKNNPFPNLAPTLAQLEIIQSALQEARRQRLLTEKKSAVSSGASKDMAITLISDLLPQIQQSTTQGVTAQRCPAAADDLPIVQLQVDPGQKDDLQIAVSYTALNQQLRDLFSKKEFCLPLLKNKATQGPSKEVSFISCYPPEQSKLNCATIDPPYIAYTPSRKGAATLELIIPSLICRNEKQRLIVDIPGSTKGKDFHIQLRPQIITGEDGTPRLSLGVQANLAQANPEVNKALDLGWLGDVFDALPHWPADFVVRQAGKRYIFDPLNESAQEMATQLPLVDLTKVTYGPAALIISGKAKTNLAANYTIYQSISRKLAQEE